MGIEIANENFPFTKFLTRNEENIFNCIEKVGLCCTPFFNSRSLRQVSSLLTDGIFSLYLKPCLMTTENIEFMEIKGKAYDWLHVFEKEVTRISVKKITGGIWLSGKTRKSIKVKNKLSKRLIKDEDVDYLLVLSTRDDKVGVPPAVGLLPYEAVTRNWVDHNGHQGLLKKVEPNEWTYLKFGPSKGKNGKRSFSERDLKSKNLTWEYLYKVIEEVGEFEED